MSRRVSSSAAIVVLTVIKVRSVPISGQENFFFSGSLSIFFRGGLKDGRGHNKTINSIPAKSGEHNGAVKATVLRSALFIPLAEDTGQRSLFLLSAYCP